MFYFADTCIECIGLQNFANPVFAGGKGAAVLVVFGVGFGGEVYDAHEGDGVGVSGIPSPSLPSWPVFELIHLGCSSRPVGLKAPESVE
jgi:hypothetical protein